jgi:proline iminopeptidase
MAFGRHIDIGDTRLWIEERGDGYPLIVLHGGPGLDHHMFGDYMDPLADRFRVVLVDQRSQGRSDSASEDTWRLEKMAEDVLSLARALGLERYAVLGHSYGALVALQNAVDFPDQAAQTIVSSGLPSAKYLDAVWENLDAFEPEELRHQVTSSWEREKDARTQVDAAGILHDQLPFHFADPRDRRIEEYERRTAETVYAPAMLRYFARNEYGGIEVEDRLGDIAHPVLVLAGRHDRTCSLEGAKAIAEGTPGSELVVFEESAHMTFVEETERYLSVVRDFLDRTSAST